MLVVTSTVVHSGQLYVILIQSFLYLHVDATNSYGKRKTDFCHERVDKLFCLRMFFVFRLDTIEIQMKPFPNTEHA